MNKLKLKLKPILEKVKNFLYKLYARSYGMDYLNKVLLISSFALSLLDIFIKGPIIYALSMILFIIFLLRFFSTKKFKRSEENRKFRNFIKFYEQKWNHRKTHRVYKCKQCGQLIRVPKGVGKVEVTCPKCGNKQEHRA